MNRMLAAPPIESATRAPKNPGGAHYVVHIGTSLGHCKPAGICG
jgi:hypothetical protein